MKRQYTAVFIKEDKWYIGYCVEINGCVTQGRTLSSCRKNLNAVIELMMEYNSEEVAFDIEEIQGEILVEGIIAGEIKDIDQLLKANRSSTMKIKKTVVLKNKFKTVHQAGMPKHLARTIAKHS